MWGIPTSSKKTMHWPSPFQDFLKRANTVNYERDARLRLGDSHFVLKAYWPAMDQYEKVRSSFLTKLLMQCINKP